MAKHLMRQAECGAGSERARRAPRRRALRPPRSPRPASLALLLTLVLASGTVLADERAEVVAVATIGMIGDVVGEVGGDCVRTTTLMGPGIDPHLYAARSGDVHVLQAADVIFYAGLSLEGQLADVLERFGERTTTVAVSELAVDPADRITTDDAYGVDPHVWMDAGLWARTPHVVADALADLAPACADAMRANAEAYATRLHALHAWAGEAIGTIPERQRILVTAHDAFAYFGRAYGIEVAGIQGISTESEAGIADVRAMADLVAERGVAAVFIESTINPRTVRAVIEAAAGRGHEVEVGGELLGDAMGPSGTAEGTYVGMVVHNVGAIVRGLGGRVPPLPAELDAWSERWGTPDE